MTRYVGVANIMAISNFAVILLVVVLGRYATAQSTEVNLPACGVSTSPSDEKPILEELTESSR